MACEYVGDVWTHKDGCLPSARRCRPFCPACYHEWGEHYISGNPHEMCCRKCLCIVAVARRSTPEQKVEHDALDPRHDCQAALVSAYAQGRRAGAAIAESYRRDLEHSRTRFDVCDNGFCHHYRAEHDQGSLACKVIVVDLSRTLECQCSRFAEEEKE